MSKPKKTKAETVARTATATAAANPTITAAVVGIPIALFLIYKLGQGFQKASSGIFDFGNTTKPGNTIVDSSPKSISAANAQLIANSILIELNHLCWTNSCQDERLQNVINVMRPIQTMSDYGLVSDAFGLIRFDGYGTAPLSPAPKRNLTYWMQTKFRRRPEMYAKLKSQYPFLNI